MKSHELICQLKDLAVELGRTPKRDEFKARYGQRYLTEIGNYSAFLQAAGLHPEIRSKEKKIDNSIFEVSIERHLENYEPRELVTRGDYPTADVISDIHWPFSAKRVIDKFYQSVGDTTPEFVIINGDAWDMYSNSKYPRSHNIFTPREERAMALKANQDFWSEIRRISPKSKCFQLMGNHDIRPMKRILEVYPAAEDWIMEALQKDFTFQGVKTIFDPREELFLAEDTIVFHGYRSQLGSHRDYTLMNCINGHTHTGGTVFRRIRGATLWEMNSGVAGDPEAKGLTYTPQKITHWTPGFGKLHKTGPQFISV